jgi:transcriptional regulator with XRE-family HTH domain
MSQRDLYTELKRYNLSVTQGHISAVERNEKNFSIEVTIAVAQLLDTSLDYLVGLTDDPSSREQMEDQVILSERDPVRREKLQRLFNAIEKLPASKRDAYWQMIETLHLGVAADTQQAQYDKLHNTRPYIHVNS